MHPLSIENPENILLKSGSLRAVPIPLSDHLEGERVRLERRTVEGWSRAYARQNQLLPYAGTGLSPGDAARLHGLATYRVVHGGSEDERFGAAMLSAVLTTGRTLNMLAEVTVVHVPILSPQPALNVKGDWSWWLPPGSPSSVQLPEPHVPRQTIARPALIELPCTRQTRQLLETLPMACGQPLIADLNAARQTLRRTIRAAGVSAPVSWVERWLFQRLATMDGGDVALAALVTGHRALLADSVVHYTAINTTVIPSLLARALDGVDAINAACVQAAPIGSRHAATIEQVRAIANAVTQPLRRYNPRVRRVPNGFHNAITCYTALFVLFSTGCRPLANPIPREGAIDTATGFMALDDKSTRDGFKSRLIWVADACRHQLALYRAHLDVLAQRLPDLAFAVVAGKPFLLDDQGSAIPLSRGALRSLMRSNDRIFPLNAGRHFLRSSLLGKVSSETLHAFLGHWHLGTEPWGSKAAFDPSIYRRELMHALPPLLEQAGWRPLSGLGLR